MTKRNLSQVAEERPESASESTTPSWVGDPLEALASLAESAKHQHARMGTCVTTREQHRAERGKGRSPAPAGRPKRSTRSVSSEGAPVLPRESEGAGSLPSHPLAFGPILLPRDNAPVEWTPTVEVPYTLVIAVEARCPSATVPRLRERLLYLASLICDPATAQPRTNYEVRLSSVLLRDACGKVKSRECYRDLLRELEAAGIVRVGASYSNSKTRAGKGRSAGKCKSYVCTFPWQGEPRARLKLETMVLKFQPRDASAALASSDPAFSYLAACYLRTTLDVPHALRLLSERHGLPPDLASGDLDTEHRERITRALAGDERGQAGLSQIIAGWVGPARGESLAWFKRDATASRLHTPVTNLSSYLRPALRIEGEGGLVSLDLKCSQPTIAAAWMRETGLVESDDVCDWFDLVARRDLYEETFEVVHGRKPSRLERDEWKRTLFREWWYARAQVMSQSELGVRLAQRWPAVHGWILERKGYTEGGHAAFPIELQRREARIFIDDLALRLERAGIVALTVHDAVLVRARDVGLARVEMLAALAVLDVPVRLSEEHYATA